MVEDFKMGVWKYLPIGSFGDYFDNNFNKDIQKNFGLILVSSKALVHFVYAVIPTIALISYIGGGIQTGEWNLRTQIQANIQRNNERNAEMKKKKDLMKKIFGEEGFADVNRDGKISLNELADAYTRVDLEEEGLDALKLMSFYNIPVEQLEKAVESYDRE